MKKQTAVDWLVEQLEQHHTSIDIKNTIVFQQAKAMEKQQVIEAWNTGTYAYNNGEQYYNETYESNN